MQGPKQIAMLWAVILLIADFDIISEIKNSSKNMNVSTLVMLIVANYLIFLHKNSGVKVGSSIILWNIW